MSKNKPFEVLQICQGYSGPFMDCARQYATLFKNETYFVTTIFLTGDANTFVTDSINSDEVIYFGYQRENLDGLKLGIISRLKKLVAERNYKLCIAHRTKPTYLALLSTTVPIISVHHALHDFDKLGRRLFVNFFQDRLTLIGVSNAVRDDMRVKLPHWPSSKIQTLYNRVDIKTLSLSQYDRQEARSKLGLPQSATIIGNVGRLHPDKDQATLIRGFAKALPQLLSNSLLVLVGEGKLKQHLVDLVSELGITEHVIFTGQITEAKRFFKAFDLFVLSSDHEPFGMVLLEAMSAGIPVICTDCGGGAEVVDGVGRLFDLGDSEQLATIIKSSLTPLTEPNSAVIKHVEEKFTDDVARENFFKIVDVKTL